MSTNVKNVSAGAPKVGGALSVAPVGTTLPTSATEELDAAFVSLGFISEDGLTNANSPETETKKAWGGATVLVNQTSKEDTFSFTLLEALNVDVLKTVYGDDNVTGNLETGIHIEAKTGQLESKAYVVDMVMRDNALKRIVIPQADLTELEEITYKDSEAVNYGMKISAMPNEKEKTHDEYIIAASTATQSADTSEAVSD